MQIKINRNELEINGNKLKGIKGFFLFILYLPIIIIDMIIVLIMAAISFIVFVYCITYNKCFGKPPKGFKIIRNKNYFEIQKNLNKNNNYE